MAEAMISLLLEYKYAFFFFGMLLGGEAILLPAIYLSLIGTLNPVAIISLALLGDIISDTVWYLIGRHFPFSRLAHLRAVERSQKFFQLILRIFDQHRYRVIFFSNFVYGTRVVTQVIAGFKRVPYFKYLGADSAGALAYFFFLFIIALIVDRSLGSFVAAVNQVKVVFPIFILTVLIVGLWIRQITIKRWSAWSSRP